MTVTVFLPPPSGRDSMIDGEGAERYTQPRLYNYEEVQMREAQLPPKVTGSHGWDQGRRDCV